MDKQVDLGYFIVFDDENKMHMVRWVSIGRELFIDYKNACKAFGLGKSKQITNNMPIFRYDEILLDSYFTGEYRKLLKKSSIKKLKKMKLISLFALFILIKENHKAYKEKWDYLWNFVEMVERNIYGNYKDRYFENIKTDIFKALLEKNV